MLRDVRLDDKYTVLKGPIYLTGPQALVKLPLIQRELDRRAGLRTGGFISGYRGSPLGTYDQQLWLAAAHLKEQDIRFVPGVNEELAATAVWGTQQLAFEPGARLQGVFGIWYAKSPGVDRAMDALRHANAAGSSPHGGVLALAGDDHPGRSASVPNQSELDFISAQIPTLNPADTEDYLRLGVHGIAMSRYSGCWSGMIVLAETVDGGASIEFDIDRFAPVLPPHDLPPPNIRWPDPHTAAEIRLQEVKLPLVLAYARANRLNRVVLDSPGARLGIMATGKAWLDTAEALGMLGLAVEDAQRLGLRLMKVDLIWPLEPTGVRDFCRGLAEVLVVEEKRPVIEPQLKDLLYHDIDRPRVVGKSDGASRWEAAPAELQLPVKHELTPAMIAASIARRLLALGVSVDDASLLNARLAAIEAAQRRARRPRLQAIAANSSAILTQGGRTPSFCSGCPHNTGTRVPEGSRALAGIGCHFMAQWIYPQSTAPFSQMGGEGAAWVGQAPFTETRHMFVNLGDGTFYHSGLLAIRQAISAGVDVTYKLLVNDAVAMTGGQPVESGGIPVPRLAALLLAEGCRRVEVVTDDVGRYAGANALPAGVRCHDRSRLDEVQRSLREEPGCTALIYEQTCAAELRRRRKKGVLPVPQTRVVINPEVCEGCGDCGRASNCLSIVPLETELGRKRAIDQNSCNHDMRCLEGFCPSFVTLTGARLKRATPAPVSDESIPEPIFGGDAVDVLVAGVGGTGVVTVSALLSMAAHLQGKAVTVLDMTGLAQKGGAVFSHVRISAPGLHAYRIRAADVVLGCDVSATVEPEVLAALVEGRTRVVSSTLEAPTGEFASNPDLAYAAPGAVRELEQRVGKDALRLLASGDLAARLVGDGQQANIVLLGFAWQTGCIPLTREAIERAIELNAVSVDAMKAAFHWGRIAAARPELLPAAAIRVAPAQTSLDERIARYVDRLREQGREQAAQRLSGVVQRVRAAQARPGAADPGLADLIARTYYQVLAIKDEYEVARMHRSPAFRALLDATFEGPYELSYHFAPPVLDRTGRAQTKRRFGAWIGPVLTGLAHAARIRDTWLDPFRFTAERRLHRQVLREFEDDLELVIGSLSNGTDPACAELMSSYGQIRGYGHVRRAALERCSPQIRAARDRLRQCRRSPAARADSEQVAG